MTFSRELFTSFKKWNDIVRLGHNKELSIKGSGSVQIKMHDGITKTLDVWYVPNLCKNLISVSTLDKKWYKYSSEDRQLRVSNGVLVVMKGKLQYEIYILIGSSMMGTVEGSQSLEQHDNCTEL